MKQNRALMTVVILIVFFWSAGLLGFIQTTSSHFHSMSVTVPLISNHSNNSHAPIKISSDDDFSVVAMSGDGSRLTPYIIQGWNITTNDSTGIWIYNTTMNFVIQDCWLESNHSSYGIWLENVTSGTAALVNNTCRNNVIGIYLSNTEDSLAINNTCYRNKYGIFFNNSRNSIIMNNTCYSNSNGIYLDKSGNSTVKKNSCLNNSVGVIIQGSESSTIQGNLCSNNSLGISIENSGNASVFNNVCSNNTVRSGIYLNESENSNMADNICTNNTDYGIIISCSQFST
ncbi:MAG: nitrous oxide reductase family maturation protein NosD, partial [Candidatus Hodarchaeota archaeon]